MVAWSKLGIGVQGSLDRSIIRELAPRVEAAGFHSFWLNDTPGGNSLEGLAVAADVTTTLRLGSGVIPLDRMPAGRILSELERHRLPLERLRLGIGSGSQPGGVARVREGIAQLREGSDATLIVGALGPRMRHLGAAAADGLLLNWLTPEAAAEAMRDLRAISGDGLGILYARMAVDPAGLRNMVAEAARYQSFPAYAANFERIGARAIDTTVYEKSPDRLADRLGQYTDVLDEFVLRAITGSHELAAYMQVVEAVVAAGGA